MGPIRRAGGSDWSRASTATRLLEAGAAGYLTKGCAVEEIVNAIKLVDQGERYIGADIARQLALSMLPGG